jgi:hypothetical protein
MIQLLLITHELRRFADFEAMAIDHVVAQGLDFFQTCSKKWDLLLMSTFFNSSLQFIPDKTCTIPLYDKIVYLHLAIVDEELAATNPPETVRDALSDPYEIPSDDFQKFPVHRPNSSPTRSKQVETYTSLPAKPDEIPFYLHTTPRCRSCLSSRGSWATNQAGIGL